MSSDHFPTQETQDAGFQASEPDPGPNGFARLWAVIVSPRRAFEAIARKPQPWVGLVPLILLIAISAALTAHITEPEQMEAALEGPFGERLAEDENYQEQMEEARNPSMGERVKGGALGGVFAGLFVALIALLYWGGCAAFGGRQGFKPTLDAVYLTSWIGAVGQFLTGFLILAKGTSIGVGLSLALLVPSLDPKSTAFIVLNVFGNFFGIWQLILLAMGFSIIHGISTRNGWLAAGIPWLLLSGFAVTVAIIFT